MEAGDMAAAGEDQSDNFDALESPRGPLRVVNQTKTKSIPQALDLQHRTLSSSAKQRLPRQDSLVSSLDPAKKDTLLDLMIKMRLFPVIIGLTKSKDIGDIRRALTEAHAVHQYAESKHANRAQIARCCYYVGVGEHGVHGNVKHRARTMLWFEKALAANAVYEESIWAQQWLNYYDDLTLSPDRSEWERRQLLTSSGGISVKSRIQKKSANGGESILSTELTSEREPGIPSLTPVSKRFSLETDNDDDLDHYESDSRTSSPRPSGRLGNRIPSFSSESSADSSSSMESLTTTTTQATFSPDFNLNQPTTPTSQDKATSLAEELERAQSPKTPSKSPRRKSASSGISMNSITARDEDLEGQNGEGSSLLDRRGQGRKSIFDGTFIRQAVRTLSFSPKKSKLTEELMEEGESPGFGPRSGDGVKFVNEED
jgi:hypothetical protein